MAFGNEVRCPAWSSIWRIQEIGTGLTGACDEDDGEWSLLGSWIRGQLFDVDLTYECCCC